MSVDYVWNEGRIYVGLKTPPKKVAPFNRNNNNNNNNNNNGNNPFNNNVGRQRKAKNRIAS